MGKTTVIWVVWESLFQEMAFRGFRNKRRIWLGEQWRAGLKESIPGSYNSKYEGPEVGKSLVHWDVRRTLEGDGGLASFVLTVAKLRLGGPEWTLRDASVVEYKMFGGRVGALEKVWWWA